MEINRVEQLLLQDSPEELLAFLQQDPTCVIAETQQGEWLPFAAARHGCVHSVQYLAERCPAVRLEHTDAAGRCLLHYAALSGSAPLVEYCIDRLGFSPLRADCCGVTPFDLAHETGGEVEQAFAARVGATYEKTYHNPVRRGAWPDPSVLAVGDDYYMVNSSFVLFPCIPISHSRDLVHWETIGYAITDPALAGLDGLPGGHGYWAPDISYYQGKYYIVATLRRKGVGPGVRVQMLTWADRPEGPYAPPVFLDEDGIDPSLFCDDDGRRYLLMNRGAQIFEIGLHGERLSPTRLLYYGDIQRTAEGPHLVKKDGWYYLFLAEGGTGDAHRVSVARSHELFGVYERCPYNPIVTHRAEDSYLFRCGHGSPFCAANGQWYLAYLCARKCEGISLLGRETAIDRMDWTPDGWPLVNSGRGPGAQAQIPSISSWQPQQCENSMEPSDVRNNWLALYEPVRAALCTDGSIVLSAEKGQQHPGSLMLHRQSEFSVCEQVRLDGSSLLPGQSAGLTGYYDETSWFTFGLSADENGLWLEVNACPASPCERIYREKVPTADILLRIEADGLTRRCIAAVPGEKAQPVATLAHTVWLGDEGAKGKRFTGALHGLFAYTSGEKATPHFRAYQEE